MNSEKLERLKVAANQFYLNKYTDLPTMSDAEYDSLSNEYASEGGSVYDLVEWENDLKRPNKPLPKVEKEQVGDNDLERAVMKYKHNYNITKSYLNYKYDGSSIIAYYDESGKLKYILGTPDCDICMDRTKNCYRMFPPYVTPGIECIQGEFLVDAEVYGQLARNKANGLLNSKDMTDEVLNEGFIRVYQMRFYDGNWSFDRLESELNKLPAWIKTRVRPSRNTVTGEIENLPREDLIFGTAEVINAPKDAIITEEEYWVDDDYCSDPVQFQVDGVVLYSERGYHAFKFYYTEYQITTVKGIEWNRQSNGGWAPKLRLEPIKLNGKSIARCATGGVPNLIGMRMGKGAKVKVILSNMTIPKVVEVIEPSDNYEFPICECGYQTTKEDIFGSGVKCQSEHCSARQEIFSDAAKDLIGDSSFEDILNSRVFDLLDRLLQVDRVSLKSKFSRIITEDKLVNAVKNSIINDDEDLFYELLDRHFHLSSLARSIMHANRGVAFDVLKQLNNIV